MPEINSNTNDKIYAYKNDPASLTKVLTIMLWISLGVTVISILSDFMQLNLLSGPFTQTEGESNDARQRAIGGLYLAVFIITGVTFLKWIYRANANCHGFGVRNMEFSPGWSIGWYFVPIANLWKPYQAMKELWNVSQNPIDWKNGKGDPLIGWWWALWLISNVLGQIVIRTSMRADSISSLKVSTTASIISGIIDIPLYIIAVSLITAIFRYQEKLVKGHA